MSYCGKNNIQDTLMYNGKIIHSLNRVPRVCSSAREGANNLINDYRSPRILNTERMLDAAHWGETEDLAINGRAFLKSATEHEKQTIEKSMKVLNRVQTPAKWRMKSVDHSLRKDNWTQWSPSFHRQKLSRSGSFWRPREIPTISRSKSFNDKQTVSVHTCRRPMNKHFIISPEWKSEFLTRGREKSKSISTTAVIPQRELGSIIQ